MTCKTILIGALNWGLGHATRCIPIINALQARGLQVILASDGAALDLWREHYPSLPWVELPSYDIQYPSSNMVWNMLWQLPKIKRAICSEYQQTATIVEEHAIDAIIADNRYGLRHVDRPSIFISHQLHLALPCWVLPPLVNALHQRYIKAFDACWVPDEAGANNLAGDLAHPAIHGVEYIGALSRFLPIQPLEQQWDVLAVLSGPEPQRQYFEDALKEQLLALPYKSLLVRGKPSCQKRQQIGELLYQQDFMHQAALQQAFGESRWVIARSGYSTLLDLATLQVPRALLVPTPGQTEQEYLALRLAQQGRCVSQKQASLNLKRGLEELENLSPVSSSMVGSQVLEAAIDKLLKKIKK